MAQDGQNQVISDVARMTLDDFHPFSVAETYILSGMWNGDTCKFSDGARPLKKTTDASIRAELLRFLVMADESLPFRQNGIRVSGAWISGVLNLEGLRVPFDLMFRHCVFEQCPNVRSAIVDNLFLDGSELPGFAADRMEARGCLSLKDATINGPVKIPGARIRGGIEADDARLSAPGQVVLDAIGLETRARVLLRGACISGGLQFGFSRLSGGIDITGALIDHPGEVALNCHAVASDGNLTFAGSKVAGETRLSNIHVAGDVDCTSATFTQLGGTALSLNQAAVEGTFLLRTGAQVKGVLDLTAASIGALHDELECWPRKGDLLLNRCRYGAFVGGPVDTASRLAWLSKLTPHKWGSDFWPQPYRQLSMVFDEMGYDNEARQVLIAKERLQRRARRERVQNRFLKALLAIRDGILSVTVRYGRQPLLALVWILMFWGIGTVVFAVSFSAGAFKPNSPLMLRSPEWSSCNFEVQAELPGLQNGVSGTGRALPGETQLACFLRQPEAVSYPEYYSAIYSLDVLLPVLSIGLKDFWRPDSRKPTGRFALRYFFFQSLIGWALGLLAVAGLSGLVKSR